MTYPEMAGGIRRKFKYDLDAAVPLAGSGRGASERDRGGVGDACGGVGFEAGQSTSSERIPKRLHAFFKNRLWKLVGAAKNKGTEVLIPIPWWSDRTRLDPFLKRQQISDGDAPLIDSLEDVLPEWSRETSELNLRQWNPSRRSRGSGLCPPRSSGLDRLRQGIDCRRTSVVPSLPARRGRLARRGRPVPGSS